jgi:Domain of unknown function (DUF4328)
VRWIAVRPGVAPARRPLHRPLSPTPRYPVNPGWGLADHGQPVPVSAETPHRGPSDSFVRATLLATAVVLGFAAAVHALRYLLLLINRDTLLPGLIAGAGLWLGVIASIAATIAVVFCAVTLTRWLISRRTAVFAHLRRDDNRSGRALWLGCLLPVVNLLWAPVFLLETAAIEGTQTRLRKPIVIWWVLWALSTALSIFATATSFTTDAQGIADNTVAVTLAYLVALATVLALLGVYDQFVRKPVDRPAHRWVVVAADRPTPPPADAPDSGADEPPAPEAPEADGDAAPAAEVVTAGAPPRRDEGA